MKIFIVNTTADRTLLVVENKAEEQVRIPIDPGTKEKLFELGVNMKRRVEKDTSHEPA